MRWWETTAFGLGSGIIWWRPLGHATRGWAGWGLRNALMGAWRAAAYNPVTTGVLLVFIGGYYYSKAVDPEEGADNYTGFLTGGEWGNDPNYWDTDENESGFFNMGQNTATIMDWYNAQALAEEQAAAEAEYIKNYDMNSYLNRLSDEWAAASPAEREAILQGYEDAWV